MFWIAFIVFVAISILLTAIILMQEPKQSGLGAGLDGGGGGADFSSLGGTAGGLHRTTIYLSIIWGVLALLLGLLPR